MKSTNRKLAMAAVIAMAASGVCADTLRLAITGESAPGGGTFSSMSGAVINSNGQVAFQSSIGAGGGIFRADGVNPVVSIVRAGDAAPGIGTFASPSVPEIASNGQVLFLAAAGSDYGLFRGDGSAPLTIARTSAAAPGGGFYTGINWWGLNPNGTAAFVASTTTTMGVFRSDGVTASSMIRAGAAAPGTGGGTFTGFIGSSINAGGSIAFLASTSAGNGIFRADSPGGVASIARVGDGFGFTTFGGVPLINATGRVQYDATNSSGEGLYYGSSGSTFTAVGPGSSLGGGVEQTVNSSAAFNDSDIVAFSATYTLPTGAGVFRTDGSGGKITIAQTNTPSPDGNGSFDTFGPPEITAGGQVLYLTTLKNTAGGALDNKAVVLSDGTENVIVARTGQVRDGSTLTSLVIRSGGDEGGYTALNDNGQVAYNATLANGNSAVYLFTPDLHWRNPSFGNWDNNSNWTLGFKPGAVHSVIIDPADGSSVTGPTAATTIKSLTVGARSTGNETLVLSSGATLTVLKDTLIRRLGAIAVDNGTLAVQGTLTNNSDLSADVGSSITTGAGLLNTSVISLRGGTIAGGALTNDYGSLLFGYGSVNAPITNLGTINTLLIPLTDSNILNIQTLNNLGLVNLPAFASIKSSGSISNTGRISINGGSISGGSITNSAGGIIDAPAATSPTPSGISSPLSNLGGIIHVGSNASLLLAALGSNTAGGQIRIDQNGTLNAVAPFANSGLVLLGGESALLTGGTINNTGTIQGAGTVSNPILNNGTIRAQGGSLTLSASGSSNTSLAQIQVPDASTVIYLQGLGANDGTISLSGGTFDNNNQALTNNGIINGHGTWRAGSLNNLGSIDVADGATSFYGQVSNNNKIHITANNTTFYGPVVNASGKTIKATGATVRFLASFTNLGIYDSDPSDTYFFDVFMAGGTWTGGVGDRFFVKGTLDWTGGSMVGAGGQTFNQGSATIHDVAVKTLDGWIFNNEKPLTLSGGNINMGNGATINNTNSFDIQSDAGITNTLGGSATFANTNVLRKSAGAGTSNVAALVTNNNGSIDVQSGTLSLNGGLNIAAGTTLQKTGGATLRVAGPQNHGAGTNLNILSGNLRLASNAGAAATGANAAVHNLTLNVTGNNTGLILESSSDVANLTIPFANAGNQSLDLNTPAAPGAFNAIRIYASDLTTAKTTLWSAIKNANAPGSPTPTDGIYDSGKSAHSNTGIGLARISDAHGDSHIQIRLARIGDLNLDGQVTISDFIDLASNFNSTGPNITWQEGDLNYDGSVTISDFIDLASNFNASYSAEDTQILASFALGQNVDPAVIGSAVPEPTSFLGLSATVLLILPRRKASATRLTRREI